MARPTFASTMPSIIAATAFVLSMFAGVYCHFISFSTTDDGSKPVTLNFGIWYYQGWSIVQSNVQGTVILESCFHYPDGTNYDSQWRSAMAFSVMVLIIGGVTTFWALLAGCLYPSRAAYKTGCLIYLLCCLFQGLTLLMLDSNACNNNSLIAGLQEQLPNSSLSFQSSCSMAAGAKCSIAATVLWFVAAVAAMKVDPPQRSPITTQTHDVTYTRTTAADGTTIVTENVVKGDPVVAGGLGEPLLDA